MGCPSGVHHSEVGVIEVPAAFAADTIAREKAAGRAWVARLPGLVRRYADRWALTLDGPPAHGYVALVVPVRVAGGAPAVLKASWLEPESIPEPAALAGW